MVILIVWTQLFEIKMNMCLCILKIQFVNILYICLTLKQKLYTWATMVILGQWIACPVFTFPAIVFTNQFINHLSYALFYWHFYLYMHLSYKILTCGSNAPEVVHSSQHLSKVLKIDWYAHFRFKTTISKSFKCSRQVKNRRNLFLYWATF